MEHQPDMPSAPVALGRPAPASIPFGGEVVYRPGARLVALVLLVPVAGAVAGAALALAGAAHTVLPWLAAGLALWVLVIPLFWLNLKRVSLTPEGIEVARPWRQGTLLAWNEIERISARRGALLLVGTGGRRLSFRPALLHDGRQLHRRLLLRVPSNVLHGTRMRQEAQRLSTGAVYRAPTGALSGALDTRAAWPWRLATLVACAVCVALAVLALVLLPRMDGEVAAGVLVALGLVALWLSLWLARQVILAESGVVLAGILPWHARAYSWESFRLVEVSRGEWLMRLRGQPSLVVIGPRLLPPRDRALAESFVREYCEARGVARVVRRRFW